MMFVTYLAGVHHHEIRSRQLKVAWSAGDVVWPLDHLAHRLLRYMKNGRAGKVQVYKPCWRQHYILTMAMSHYTVPEILDNTDQHWQ